MKKKMASALTMCVAASLILTSAGVTAFASEVNDETKEETKEKTEEEIMAISLTEPDELDWTEEQMASLSDIVSGMDDKEYDAGSASKYDIHMSVTYDKDIVSAVLFNTADLDCSASGEYNVSYFVYFNREALLDYIKKNDLNEEDFPGLTDAKGDLVMITVNGKVAIKGTAVVESSSEQTNEKPANEESTYEEPVYEESTNVEPTYEEPVYNEPVYNEPAYEEPAYEEPAYEEPASTGRTLLNVETIYDCDGSGHGYYIYHYSDGSEEYVDF